MHEEIEQRRGLATVELNVTVSPLLANRIIAATIRRFRRSFPNVFIQINGGHELMAFGPLRDRLVDVVIGWESQGSDAAALSMSFRVETRLLDNWTKGKLES